MERFPPIAPSARSAQQQSLADFYTGGWRGQLASSDGRLGGPLDAMLRSPEMSRRLSTLSDYFRKGTSLDQRINEFAVILAARLHDSHYEWSVHSQWAMREGLARDIVEAVAAGRRPAQMQADEEAAYDLMMELASTRRVCDPTFERARAVFGEQQLVDLVAVFGLYRMVAGILALADVLPAGPVAPPLSDLGQPR